MDIVQEHNNCEKRVYCNSSDGNDAEGNDNCYLLGIVKLNSWLIDSWAV
jgi:hypothetical protein